MDEISKYNQRINQHRSFLKLVFLFKMQIPGWTKMLQHKLDDVFILHPTEGKILELIIPLKLHKMGEGN